MESLDSDALFFDSFDFADNCTLDVANDYCEPVVDYVARIERHLQLGVYEWSLVVFYVIVFTVGLVGNALVVCVVLFNPFMRTVTNVFLVNLAVADFLVILLCMPPTLVEDIRQTWYFGAELCKLAKFMQHISVTVSVLTLVVISFERWQAICRPFHVRRTPKRSYCILAIVWIAAFVICLPQLFSMNVSRFEKLPPTYLLFSECKSSWNRDVLLPVKYAEMVVLFFLPFTWMGLAYIWIVRELWYGRKQDRVESTQNQPRNLPTNSSQSQPNNDSKLPDNLPTDRQPSSSIVPREYGFDNKKNSRVVLSTDSPGIISDAHRTSPTVEGQFTFTHPSTNQMRKRRRAALMLILIVAIFFISYLPVHVIDIIRNAYDQRIFDQHPMLASALNALAKCLHLLCFINSAINPIIYNFMSTKFKREFKRFCQRGCLCRLRSERDHMRCKIYRTYEIHAHRVHQRHLHKRR